MIKKCVQKPYTVLVAVIIALLIGAVSLTKLQTDLLPDMTVPYMMVVTTYPGASPEKVERDVTQPLESALGTVSGVENVTSVSAENYSMITLEFADDMNMDSAMVKLNTQLDAAKSSLPDSCGTPNIMEISMDMMATVYASVSKDDADIYDISDPDKFFLILDMRMFQFVIHVDGQMCRTIVAHQSVQLYGMDVSGFCQVHSGSTGDDFFGHSHSHRSVLLI